MYAYNFQSNRNGIDHSLIFVAMPFDDKYDNIYNDLIVPATAKANDTLGYGGSLSLRAFRTKDDIRTTSGWINVLENLSTAQIVIGLLTGNNKNVFYELGIAHATQQIARQILIANKGYKPSFDTKDLIYLVYNKKNIAESIDPLAGKIVEAIKAYNLDNEMTVIKARGSVGMSGFTAIMTYGGRRNFAVHTAELKDDHALRNGLDILCQLGLLHLNTASKLNNNVPNIEFSYWWTGIGNDVLKLLKIIDEEQLLQRRKDLPPYLNL
jgi:hypothetical protein